MNISQSRKESCLPTLEHCVFYLTLALCDGRFGTLSTVGLKGEGAGFPTGSFVQYASDAEGRPVFAFSSLSTHMQDIESDPRCSLTVTSPTFKVRGVMKEMRANSCIKVQFHMLLKRVCGLA